jgi:hypothetical protein
LLRQLRPVWLAHLFPLAPSCVQRLSTATRAVDCCALVARGRSAAAQAIARGALLYATMTCYAQHNCGRCSFVRTVQGSVGYA